MSKGAVKRAISIRQPYAEQILQGKKKFEYRSRLTTIRGRVYIYAALKEAKDANEKDYRSIGKDFASLPKGVIVGSVEIAGCKDRGKNQGFAYGLVHPKRLRRLLKASNQPQPLFWIPIIIRK